MRRLIFVAAALLLAVSALPNLASADRYGTRVTLFYSDLAPYGRWVEHRVYGTIWIPASGRPDWHPYTEGRWVWTSDYGWYWDSYEEFGWATYHYGRWVLTAEYGWAWVPDDVWGPAWVEWRYGDGYTGWSPMPPEHHWSGGVVVQTSVDLGQPKYARNWVFVSDRDFVATDVRTRLRARSEVQAQLAGSTRSTNYAVVKGHIVNRSVDRARISKAAQVDIKPVSVGVVGSVAATAGIRSHGQVPLYQPRAAVHDGVNLDAPIDYAAPPASFDAGGKLDVPPPPAVSSGSVGSAAVGSGIDFDRPSTRGLPGVGGVTGGVTGGVGGGLRLGR